MTVHHQIVVFRRRSSVAPINSIKHVIDTEGTLLSTGAASVNTICQAVANVSSTFNPIEVRVGAKVNGFFLSIFIIGATGAPIVGSVNWYIIKLHDGQSAPQPGETGISKVRNQIFHEEKGLAGSGDGTPMAFKGVIAVPRGMRRMREGDQFQILLSLNAIASGDATFCLKAIYKDFF